MKYFADDTQHQEESRKENGRKITQVFIAHKLQTQTVVEEVPKQTAKAPLFLNPCFACIWV